MNVALDVGLGCVRRQRGDGHAAAVGMAGQVGRFPEGERRHPAGVVGPLLQIGDDFSPQFVHFMGRESGIAEDIGRNIQDTGKVFGQTLDAEASLVNPGGDADGSPHRLHLLV
ncbi:hypothetical protein, partial [Thermogutta sp.]|uniref:hypothetical protein n=1 Tax=Thermogutta sp. TaxID=1962930 RepID=UPI00321FA851